LAEVIQTSFLEERRKSAVEAVRTKLEGDGAFQLVSQNEVGSLLKDASVIWRTHIHTSGQDWTVDIGLPKRFPDEAPMAYVHDWEQIFLRNPHVLKGGCLCTIPGSAALDSSDPVGLVRYVYDKAKEILDGTSTNDFKEEFSYYWSRCTTDGSQNVLIIDSIDKLERSFPVVFCKGYVCVASSIERLNRWVSNRIGKTSELTSNGRGILLNLNAPLLPQSYPSTLAELVSLAEVNDPPAAEMINNDILTSSSRGFTLLVQKEGQGVALGGIIFSGLYSSKFTHGFRPGNVPLDVLRSRIIPFFRSTKVTRSEVIQVDHRRIHSRGGDGRDLSKKAVLLIGCGSLGGYVAHLLSRTGVGRLTVTDNDQLGWENVGRHILGASSLGRYKAEALAEELMRELPHLEITGIPKDWRDVFESNPKLFSEFDLVISTVADWRCEGPLNALVRETQMPPLLLGWLEPYAVAGHCLVVSHDGGCFECSSNAFGQFERSVANFKETTISREPGGCAHYQRYGPIALMPVASMIASVAVESLLNAPAESFLHTWVSSAEHFKSVGAGLSEAWAQEVDRSGYSRTFRKPWKKSNSCRLCTKTES
jgi:hypothetical protein